MGGFVIEDPNQTEGVTMQTITGKIAKRAVLNADITLENVRIPKENRLAQTQSFKDTAKVLAFTRYAVAWEAAGLAAACFELALQHMPNNANSSENQLPVTNSSNKNSSKWRPR